MTDRALRLPLAMTMGDPAGIGPELALRAWLARDSASPPFFVLADPAALAELGAPVRPSRADRRNRAGDSAAAFATALPVVPLAAPAHADPGATDPAFAAATIESIERAVAYVKVRRSARRRHQPDRQGDALRRRLQVPRPHRIPRRAGGARLAASRRSR